MRNYAGVCSRGTLYRYCSSRISSGTHSTVQTSFTTIETKRYSSGRKNTPANIGKHMSNLTERTSRCSRRHFPSGLRNPRCLRSLRMGDCGGRRAAMHGGNRGRSLRRATSMASAIACNPAFRWESWSLELRWIASCDARALPKAITMMLASGFRGMGLCGTQLNMRYTLSPCDTKISHDLFRLFVPLL